MRNIKIWDVIFSIRKSITGVLFLVLLFSFCTNNAKNNNSTNKKEEVKTHPVEIGLAGITTEALGDNYFMVQGEYNLEKLFFDEYTSFFIGDQQAESTDFAKGDIITVSFAKLYETYDPKVVVANKIGKN